MKCFKLLIQVTAGVLASLFLLALAQSVTAADLGGAAKAEPVGPAVNTSSRSWTGLYVGGVAGYGIIDTKVSTSPAWGSASLDGIAAEGFKGGLTAGADVQFSGTALVLGGRGSWTTGAQDFTIGAGGVNLFKASAKDGWSLDGRLGYVMGSALPYVFAGYTEVNTSASFAGTAITGVPDLKGKRFGGGVEWRLPNTANLMLTPTLGLEYTYTDYDSLSFGTAPKTVTFDPHEHAFMARLNLRFQPFKASN